MKRVLSVIIVLCLLATATINILATDNNNDASNGYNDYKTIEKKDYELEIAEKKKSSDEFEVVSLREECVKHFAQKDGTIKAIVYPFPVHFLSEDDKWEDLYDYDRSVPLTAERFESLRDGNNYSVNGYENYDTYISQSYPSTNFFGLSENIVGTNEITYYYCANPDIPDNATVVSSSVSYNYWFQSGITSGIIFIEVYEAVAAWDPFDITYNNSGTNNGLATTPTDLQYMIASSSITSNSPGQCSFDITELTKDWYAGKQNNGIGFKRMTGSISQIYFCSNSHYWPVYSVTYTIGGLVAENGVYYIYNIQDERCLQIDANSPTNLNQATMELRSFLNYNDRQKWELKYLHNGYYRIISKASNMSLSVASGGVGNNGTSIVQETYSANDRQQWSFDNSSSNHVVIRPKSSNSYPNNDLAMTTTFGQPADGKSVIQSTYSNNANFIDEWSLIKIVMTNTPFESQEHSNWCWVASARMFSRNYSSCVQASQLDGATYLFPTNPYQKGSMVNILTLVHYYTSMNNNLLPLDTFSQHIYSQEILSQFIDDGHPVIISIGYYLDISNSQSKRWDHAMVVYGYFIMEGTYYFLIRDPGEDINNVNFKETIVMEYDSIVFSANQYGNYYAVWDACVFYQTQYAYDWENYFFLQ